jgi:hypothetical protein
VLLAVICCTCVGLAVAGYSELGLFDGRVLGSSDGLSGLLVSDTFSRWNAVQVTLDADDAGDDSTDCTDADSQSEAQYISPLAHTLDSDTDMLPSLHCRAAKVELGGIVTRSNRVPFTFAMTALS